MIIHVLKDMTVQLEQLDDFKKFSVLADVADDHIGRVEQALAGLAEFESPKQAWVFAEMLKARSGRTSDVGWSGRFDAMVSGAAKHGWVRENPTRIAAHIVWQDH